MFAVAVTNGAVQAEMLASLFPARATAFAPEMQLDPGAGFGWGTALSAAQSRTGLATTHRDMASGRVVFFYGRLFDPAEQRTSGGARPGRSPAELAFDLYASGDPHWLERLHGQFAVVVWDPAQDRIIAARDRFGIVPLYYRRSRDGITFASTAKQLLKVGGSKSGPDRGMIARYLVDDVLRSSAFSQESTFFADIKRLKAGLCLTFGKGTLEQKPYWDVTQAFREPKVEHPDPAAYLSLFERVVHDQIGDVQGVGSALSGGYTVHPALAGPPSTNSEASITTLLRKKNQYESMLMKPLAMSRAPSCKGISRLAKVPDRPPVSTKNTMMVPWIVTSARYMLGSSTPPGAHFSPRKKLLKAKLSPGQASCRRNSRDMITATHAMTMAVTRNCLLIIL